MTAAEVVISLNKDSRSVVVVAGTLSHEQASLQTALEIHRLVRCHVKSLQRVIDFIYAAVEE